MIRIITSISVFLIFFLSFVSFLLLLPVSITPYYLILAFFISLVSGGITYLLFFYAFKRHILWMQECVSRAMNYIKNPHMKYPEEEPPSDLLGNIMDIFKRGQEEIRRDIAKRDEFIKWLTEEVNRCSFELNKKNKELIEKERNIALGHLIATIAHKLGTPLNSISGHIQLILTGNKIDYDTKNRLNIINQEIIRIEKIIRQALDVLMFNNIKCEKVDIRALLSEVIDFLLPSIQKDVESVELKIDPDFPEIYSDPDMIREVVTNLISNANEAIEGNGFIQIVVERGNDNLCCIKVIDNGVGISADIKDKIFEPFFTTKHKGKASGLGLAISREIARALGGDIVVESTIGKGSIFTFTFKDRKEGIL